MDKISLSKIQIKTIRDYGTNQSLSKDALITFCLNKLKMPRKSGKTFKTLGSSQTRKHSKTHYYKILEFLGQCSDADLEELRRVK